DFHGGKTQQAREMIQSLGAMQPAGRIGRPEEVAAGILYFCQPLSEWTTGAVLSIDGGINLV
ncbi:MAG: SDR family oxidoreductase, partial [Bdellovibrionaceae bacterium]|nr:SDR family oxidoreductase [Pseudobdellovibrionaceae bacterium]